MGKILIMKSLLEKKGSEKVSDRHACSEEVAKRAELRTRQNEQNSSWFGSATGGTEDWDLASAPWPNLWQKRSCSSFRSQRIHLYNIFQRLDRSGSWRLHRSAALACDLVAIEYLALALDSYSRLNLQKDLMSSGWQALRPGGLLVYSTCTLNHEENERQCCQLQEQGAQVVRLDEQLVPSTPEGFLRVWPHWLDVEGFFVACFYKAALLLQDSESRRREGLARRLLMWIRLHRWIV
eukprot:g28992.t1